MRNIPYILFTLAASCLLSGCITEYTPKTFGDHEELLVVEGVIIDGETVIRLSKSASLNSGSGPTLSITDAQVWIEGESGVRFDALESVAGEYRASNVSLSDDIRYRLRISWEGREYESSYRHPQSTPPIDKIAFYRRGQEESLQVRLDVTGQLGGSRHYLWSYEETWEIRARMMASHHFGYSPSGDSYPYIRYIDTWFYQDPADKIEIFEYPNGVSTSYYCWRYEKSKEILLADTERMTSNVLRDHVLYEIPFTDDRISTLYHTKISLYSIAEDAYYYYSNQKKNTDQTGSIFAPIPSEMQGNIVCSTSPELPVIGFIDVSRRTEKDIFMDSYDYPFYQRPYKDCTTFENEGRLPTQALYDKLDNLGMKLDVLYLVSFSDFPPMPPTMILTYLDCIDCRLQGGSKLRPSWWPNDHI